MLQRLSTYILDRCLHAPWKAAPHGGFRSIEKTACLWVQEYNLFALCLEYHYPARQGVEYLAQHNPHALVFRNARSQGLIALFQLPAQLRNFTVQLPVRILKPVRSSNKCGERTS